MGILLLVAFVSGLVTILAPCIWPLLPIILSSTATSGKGKALGITIGICASFLVFTLTISYLVSLLKFDPNILRLFAVLVIGLLGVSLAVPWFSSKLEAVVSKLTGKLGLSAIKGGGFSAGLITGIALGIVWTPCAGPILATIATLAATKAVNLGVVLVALVYVVGIGIPLFLFALAGSALFSKSKILNRYTGRIQQIFGVVMIITALLIFTNYDKVLQAKLLNFFPSYSQFLNKFEGTAQKQLDLLKSGSGSAKLLLSSENLENLGPAQDFVGIFKWLNTDRPLTIADLKGKVVLVDFWTYTCINCIRTLPYVTGWYDKYHDSGFVVVGVHTPEFEFEKKTENVLGAIAQYKIHYPVAQDNDYKTWDNYSNRYWPAKYLIDAKGNIRYVHFGEGDYDKTEMAIKQLLEEAGVQTGGDLVSVGHDTVGRGITPETYLGLARLTRFDSDQKPVLGDQKYSFTGQVANNYFAYEGDWNLSNEYGMAGKSASLTLNFNASKVYLVMGPKAGAPKVNVYLDGKLIAREISGEDVKDGVVTLSSERLYKLVNLAKVENFILKLEFVEGNVSVFAFTFG